MAGLASMIFGDNPFTQWGNENSSALSALGAGLASGPTFQQGLSNGAQLMAQMGPADAERAEKARLLQEEIARKNKTIEWLRQTDPQLAAMVEAGMDPNAAFGQIVSQRNKVAGNEFDHLKEINGQLVDMRTGKTVGDYRSPDDLVAGGDAETFFSPIKGFDAAGNPVFVQPGNRGGSTVMDLPEGFQPQGRLEKVDLGTEWLITDTTTGQTQRIPKDNYGAALATATGTEVGKATGENIAAAESLSSKMPGLRTVVAELGELAKTATYTVAGQVIDEGMRQAGMEPSEAAIARTRYIAVVDNQVLPLLRDTFGAAFTVKEGETLRATLGDPNKSPLEKQAVLESFIAQKERDVQAMNSRIPPGGGGAGDVDAILKGLGIN